MTDQTTQTTQVHTENFICPNCGGGMRHHIQKDQFLCSSCGYEGTLHPEDDTVDEHDLNGYLQREAQNIAFNGMAVTNCQSCGKQITFGEHDTATTCPMCGSTQISQMKQKAGIPPEGIMPFKVDQQEAGQKFHQWVKGLWFAPNKLKKSYQAGNFTGRFVPFWTYDADCLATYTGQGGNYRTVKDEDGKEHTETDWFPTSGAVEKSFDDILVLASAGEGAQDADRVGPYDTINGLRPYAPEYLAGYQAELYSVKADVGFASAKVRMESDLYSLAEEDIRRRFDTSRSVQIHPQYSNVTYKHVLLPIWSSIFGYAGKTYRCVINGATGNVYGDRPYSAIKIIAAITVTAAVILGGFALFTSDTESVSPEQTTEQATVEQAYVTLPSQQRYKEIGMPTTL